MPFLVEEDEALKAKLEGLVVSDSRQAQRKVEVWFGQPDLELQARTYPFISIELVDITEANERVVSGQPFLSYLPEGYTAPAAGSRITAHQFPTPYDLDYQITLWTRHPRHDRALVAALLQGRLPIRFGSLVLPRSHRVVRLDMLDGPQVADTTDENGKRLFRKVFTVRVATELFLENALKLVGLVKEVVLLPPDGDSPDGYAVIEARVL